MNSGVKELHKQLIEAHRSLAKRLGKTMDRSEAEDILREMDELNFRVIMAGRLLFHETTARIDRKIGTITEVNANLDERIKRIENIKDLVKTVAQYLADVDDVLDTIKML
jgi:hypothetical protein